MNFSFQNEVWLTAVLNSENNSRRPEQQIDEELTNNPEQIVKDAEKLKNK